MEINITLEQALQKASPGLRLKMQHSIELLKKAEQLSLLYDNGGGIFSRLAEEKTLRHYIISHSYQA